MTPRDRLQRLLFEHRTAHDPASSEREILRMFEALEQLAFVVSTDATQPEFRREHARGLLERGGNWRPLTDNEIAAELTDEAKDMR